MVEPLLWRGQLSHIALRCPDVSQTSRFYRDVVGMAEHRADEDAAARLGWGRGHHALDLLPGEMALDHFGLEVPEPRELDAVLNRLRDHGVPVEHRGEDAVHGETHVVTDPDGRTIELHGRVDRSGEFAADSNRRPTRLQHITLATVSVPALLDFYAGPLAMRVSDRMDSAFAWLRCGAEHHTVAMVQAPSATGLDHFSFDLNCWDDFASWADRLSTLGVPLTWGPGRHGPGNNLFVMFDDPDRNHVELSAEMELYHDGIARYERTWRQHPLTTNLWGIGPSWRDPARGQV